MSLLPIDKVFGVVVKGTKKLVAIFKDAKSAEKAVEKAGAKLDNNIHRDDDLFTTAPGGGAERSTKYSGNWQKADLKLTIEKFTGKTQK